MDHTIRVDRPSEQVIPDLVSALQRQELRATISFDLRLARAGQINCDCPHHGMEGCTCQYAVLLVYDPEWRHDLYRTITIHGRDGQVWLSLVKNPIPSTQATSTHGALEAKVLDILLSLVATSNTEDVAVDGSVAPRKDINDI